VNFKRRITSGLVVFGIIASGGLVTASSASANARTDEAFMRGMSGPHRPYSNAQVLNGGHQYCNDKRYYNRNIPWYKVGHGQIGARQARANTIHRFGKVVGGRIAYVAENSIC
jgi:hypothetical protein